MLGAAVKMGPASELLNNTTVVGTGVAVATTLARRPISHDLVFPLEVELKKMTKTRRSTKHKQGTRKSPRSKGALCDIDHSTHLVLSGI